MGKSALYTRSERKDKRADRYNRIFAHYTPVEILLYTLVHRVIRLYNISMYIYTQSDVYSLSLDEGAKRHRERERI